MSSQAEVTPQSVINKEKESLKWAMLTQNLSILGMLGSASVIVIGWERLLPQARIAFSSLTAAGLAFSLLGTARALKSARKLIDASKKASKLDLSVLTQAPTVEDQISPKVYSAQLTQALNQQGVRVALKSGRFHLLAPPQDQEKQSLLTQPSATKLPARVQTMAGAMSELIDPLRREEPYGDVRRRQVLAILYERLHPRTPSLIPDSALRKMEEDSLLATTLLSTALEKAPGVLKNIVDILDTMLDIYYHDLPSGEKPTELIIFVAKSLVSVSFRETAWPLHQNILRIIEKHRVNFSGFDVVFNPNPAAQIVNILKLPKKNARFEPRNLPREISQGARLIKGGNLDELDRLACAVALDNPFFPAIEVRYLGKTVTIPMDEFYQKRLIEGDDHYLKAFFDQGGSLHPLLPQQRPLAA